MASAVICLAIGRKFNFSKYIFDSMVFAMRRIGKGFSGIETPLFATMLVQPQAAAEEEDEEDEVLAAATPPSPTHEPSPPLHEPITSSPQAQIYSTIITTIERKYDDNAADKEVNVAEPTVFNDEEVTMTMAQTLINMKAEKARLLDEQMAKRLHDKEVKQAAAKEKQEKDNFKKAKVYPTHDPKDMSEEDVKNMLEIVLVSEFKVEALQVKEDLDALWRLVKDKFSTTVPTVDKEKALWVELKRLFEPDIDDALETSKKSSSDSGCRVDIKTKNVGYGGNGNRNAGRHNRNQAFNAGTRNDESNQIVQCVSLTELNLGKANVQCYNCNEKGYYACDCQKPRARDAKYFREQMLLAMKDEAGTNLKDEEDDFMLDNSYRDETLEE
nr:hypothetical protein [Tanacetum cinerariifolium]